MIVAVAGGKGGVGKSTVAYNLAAAFDAVVVDADLGMADLPTDRGPDLHDVLAGRADVLEAVREGGPVDLLPCGRSLAGARAANPTALVDALERVEREYGRVVVDVPAGLRADVGLPLFAAKAVVLVTTPEEAAIADALRVHALARNSTAGWRGSSSTASTASRRSTSSPNCSARRSSPSPSRGIWPPRARTRNRSQQSLRARRSPDPSKNSRPVSIRPDPCKSSVASRR